METESRKRAYLLVPSATTAIGALASSLGGPVATVIGAMVGFAWGIGIGFISTRLVQHRPNLPRHWLFVAAFIATTLFGGSLFAMLLYVASPTPENVLSLMRPPFRGGFTFFLIFNSLMEWLVIPLAVFLNWQNQQRRPLLVACAVLFYLSRAWTYIYFVPQIFQFMAVPASASLSAELTTKVIRWVNLSWIRCMIDGVTALLFLRATSRSEAF